MNTYESINVGDTFTTTRFISVNEVQTFSEITGDDNPLHIDPEYADHAGYGRPIVHGILLLGIISKVLGRDFPGHGSVAVSVSCRFLRPVPVDSEVTVEVRVFKKIEKYRHIKMRAYVYAAGKMAINGEAVIRPPDGDVTSAS